MASGWNDPGLYEARIYSCGHCGKETSTDRGYYNGVTGEQIYICSCSRPTIMIADEQIPGPLPFELLDIGDDHADIEQLFSEVRKAHSAQAYSLAVMGCRKLLMHIAVDKGDKPGRKFIEYVQFLEDRHFIPVSVHGVADKIRKEGNRQNHEIISATKEDSNSIIYFTGMLIKMIYEMPHK